MVGQVAGAIWRLWQTSSPWRQSVIVGVIGALLLFAGAREHGGCFEDPARCEKREPLPTPQPTETRPGTPPLPQALGFYRMSYQRIEKDYDAGALGKGARCERISTAFDEVPSDLQDSADSRVKQELDQGRACQELLSRSDQRFASFSAAVSQADAAADRSAIDAVTSAMHAFDAFDQTRSEFATTRAKADKFPPMVQKAEKEFAGLQRTLEEAGRGNSEAAQQALMHALDAIAPADEKLATQDQKELLNKARHSFAQFAASQLSAAIAALGADHSLPNYQKVVTLYRTVKSAPSDAAPIDPGVLSAAAEAESDLVASDDRLKALSEAGKAWGKHHDASTCLELTQASEALRALDRSRIAHNDHGEIEAGAGKAQRQFQASDLILHGQQYWADAKEKKRVPVLFQPQDSPIASDLGDAIGRLGYTVTSDIDSASLVIEVSISDTRQCGSVGEDRLEQYCSDISVNDASWVCGGSVNLPNIPGGRTTGNEDAARSKAIANFISAFDHNTGN